MGQDNDKDMVSHYGYLDESAISSCTNLLFGGDVDVILLHNQLVVLEMNFEAYKISENNYQLYIIKEHQRIWLASFNSLNTLLNYYIYCHNLTYDSIMFCGVGLNDKEQLDLDYEVKEWQIDVVTDGF